MGNLRRYEQLLDYLDQKLRLGRRPGSGRYFGVSGRQIPAAMLAAINPVVETQPLIDSSTKATVLSRAPVPRQKQAFRD